MAFNNSSEIEIYRDAINNVHGSQYNIQNIYHPTTDEEILRDLARRAAMNATHDSDPVSALNCHPGTRVQTLRTLHKWISKRKSNTRVQWVHGSAGVGKSAIAQKTTENHRKNLVGAFFFSRNDPTRDKLEPFVATIAYQCCTSSHLRKVVGPLIIDAIRSDPNIFNTPSKVQFRKLILEPFSLAKWSWQRIIPNLLVVDGIDECVDRISQQKLIEIVDYAVSFQTPTPLIFLLCSRLEHHIHHCIDNASFTSFLKCIEVSGTTIRFTGELTESDLDIQKYFIEKFAELRRKYPGVLEDQGEMWPSADDVAHLVRRASGQFIFAVTVIGFVDADDERPQDRLETILSIESEHEVIHASPYPALDLLYQQILSSCRHWDKVHPILRLLLTPRYAESVFPQECAQIRWFSPAIITQLLQLGLGTVQMVLRQLRSVIYLPEDSESEIRVLHASFREFLMDKARSGDYFVLQYPKKEYNNLVVVLLLQTLSFYSKIYPPYYHCTSARQSDTAITKWEANAKLIFEHGTRRYFAVTSWAVYCCIIKHPSDSLLAQLDEFDPCVVMALVLTGTPGWNLPSILSEWRGCLIWAKSLGVDILQNFIVKMESFLCGNFYVGYGKDSSRRCAIRTTLYLECGFTVFDSPRWNMATTMAKFVWQYYQQWYPADQTWTAYPMVFSSQTDSGVILPENCVLLHVTKANGEELLQAYTIRKSLKRADQKVFDDDILYDTSECVSRNLVKELDLVAFKMLLYERRDLLADLAVKNPNSPKRANFETIKRWFQRQAVEE